MRTFRSALLAGAAAVAVGCSGVAALAQTSDTHVMTVRLPDGGVAQIRYTGNVAPKIRFDQAAASPLPVAMFPAMPVAAVSMFGPDSPFAQLDRISAEMDRQAAAMLQQAHALANAPAGQLSQAAMRNLPPGGESYSFISTMSGSGVCSQSVEITSQGNGAAPKVVRHSSGDCGAPAGGAAGSVNLPTATAPSFGQPSPVWIDVPQQQVAPRVTPIPTQPTGARPDVLWTSAHGAKPYAGLVAPIPPAPPR